jgi:acid phosphatase family membrane protein YuiD
LRQRFANLSVATAFAVVALLTATAVARADGMENSLFDFNAMQQKFGQQKKQQEKQGYVLQNLKDKTGTDAGTLSFGGANDVVDPYQQFSATRNFRGSNSSEIDGPKLNLQLSF